MWTDLSLISLHVYNKGFQMIIKKWNIILI